MRRTLYVTVDGLLQPLGYSQVFRVVEGLAQRGVPYAVVSMERLEDLANEKRVETLTQRLRAVGVDWTPLPYVQGERTAAARNVARLTAAALSRARRGDIGLVHARSYHGAAIALAVRIALGIEYVFDTRSYWIDERHESGRWFQSRPTLAGARILERELYRRAAAVVTLTRLQADDVAAGRFGEWANRPLEVITTCADFEEFRLLPREQVANELRDFAGESLVLGFVGSVNASYRLGQAIDLARRVLVARRDAKIVALGADPAAYSRAFSEAGGIDGARVLARRVEHSEIASWIGGIDWGFLMLATSPAKRASMPTKLGEFLAAGVRPIHHGCNLEVSDWIERTGSGLSLPRLEADDLADAARHVASSQRDLQALERARSVAEGHFSLAHALVRYDMLVRSLA